MIRQHDSMQCGIACLQMICKYFLSQLFLLRYKNPAEDTRK